MNTRACLTHATWATYMWHVFSFLTIWFCHCATKKKEIKHICDTLQPFLKAEIVCVFKNCWFGKLLAHVNISFIL